MHQQVYNLSGKQQGELKDRLDKLRVVLLYFKGTETIILRQFWREEKKRLEMHSEIIRWHFIQAEVIPSKIMNELHRGTLSNKEHYKRLDKMSKKKLFEQAQNH